MEDGTSSNQIGITGGCIARIGCGELLWPKPGRGANRAARENFAVLEALGKPRGVLVKDHGH